MTKSDFVVGDNIRTGVAALARKHGHAEVIAAAENQPYVFVDLGEIGLDGYGYDQPSARVILRIHKDFPDGQHYGMVTVPVLTVDGRQPQNTTINKDQAHSIRDAGVDDDYLYWSRDWRELSVSRPEDMAKGVAFVRGTLRHPFKN